MSLTPTEIMKRHCMYQTSWTGDQICKHVKGNGNSAKQVPSALYIRNKNFPQRSRPSSSRISNIIKVMGNDKDNIYPNRRFEGNTDVNKEVLESLSLPLDKTEDNRKRSPFEYLQDRRQYRLTRRKPWTEKSMIARPSKKYQIEYVYETNLPENLEGLDVKRLTRKYVTNPKYGNLYEIRQEIPAEPPPVPQQTWMWEEKFYSWLFENDKARLNLVNMSRDNKSWRSSTDRTTTVGMGTPRSERNTVRSVTPSTGRSTMEEKPRARSQLATISPRPKQQQKPHADLFAHYHSYRLEKQKQADAAILLQRMFRGWRIRHLLNKLKRKARLEHGCSWTKFITEYKELVTRIQSRYGEMKPFCRVDLEEIKSYIDQKFKYERAFEQVSYGDKLLKSDLGEFFQNCGLHPTKGDIEAGFNSVFRGSGNTGEVVFVLDCSSSVGKFNFVYLMSFVKDVISSFDVGPDRVRVGVIPFTEDILQAFSITKYSTKDEIINGIDLIQPKEGLTRTDLALKLMNSMFSGSRPGVRKIGIVVTDGKSSEPDLTKIAAKKAHDDHIDVFAIGVGETVDIDELSAIATTRKHILRAHDYQSLRKLKEDLTKGTCLAACVLCQSIIPRIMRIGLYKSEAMEILWSLNIPPGCNIRIPKTLNDSSKESHMSVKGQGKCRPLTKSETIEILWTIYPPSASCIDKKSCWIRPIIDGTEAWALLDKSIKDTTDIKTCLRLVIQSKIEREGYILLPSDIREGVQEVRNPDEAVAIVEQWMKTNQKEK